MPPPRRPQGPTAEETRARVADWEPKTELGRGVKSGEVTSMAQALKTGLPLREPEVVDVLLPGMEDEVIDVNMVQRMTDSGRRVRFRIVSVVGNRDGYVGIGMAKGKEVGPSIRNAIDVAKLNIIQVRRGCGSWRCGCGTAHSVPVEVVGKAASVEITLKPAPRGTGLAVSAVAKQVLGLAGVRDVWGLSSGQTKTTINNAQAAFDALLQTSSIKMTDAQKQRLNILEGSVAGL
ncbi:MAG TPA: 30S ribosomal protein S5 [Candidatus Thermoplasmatota archaeon]|jgi:small subunit ribosomal protein S5|nr:30S ribosomal protein S5 [Candidatus Thermoplasmatota archaeon]